VCPGELTRLSKIGLLVTGELTSNGAPEKLAPVWERVDSNGPAVCANPGCFSHSQILTPQLAGLRSQTHTN
jgi:hypothetical protein